jgi:Na+/H+-dicarboxylate symporter
MVVNTGGASLLSMFKLAGTTIFTFFLMMIVYSLLILVLARLNPITFFRKSKEGLLTSFSLSSSSAAMPTNLRVCKENLGVSPKVCNFSIPLGATVNMDGTCIYLSVIGLSLARAYGVAVPPASMLPLILTIIMLSMGAPGVPGSALVCLGIVLEQLNVPLEAVGLIMALSPLIDMFSTVSNVTGDMTATLIVAKSEGLVDMQIYNQ